MRARPIAVGLSTDLKRHPESVSGVVAGAANLGRCPAWPQVAGAPFGVGLKAAAGKYHGARTNFLFAAAIIDHTYSRNTRVSLQQRCRPGVVADRDPLFLSGLEFGIHQRYAAF